MDAMTVKPAARFSWKAKTLYTALAVVSAVVLPQIFHAVGAFSGAGTVPGEMFLPMHMPILLVGLLAGVVPGAIAGLLAPLISFLLSGMPTAAMLPFMMIELCGYGLFAGLLKDIRINTFAKLLLAQIAGRAARACAVLFAVYILGKSGIHVSSIITSIRVGLPGILLQWAVLPLLMYRINHASKSA